MTVDFIYNINNNNFIYIAINTESSLSLTLTNYKLYRRNVLYLINQCLSYVIRFLNRPYLKFVTCDLTKLKTV